MDDIGIHLKRDKAMPVGTDVASSGSPLLLGTVDSDGAPT